MKKYNDDDISLAKKCVCKMGYSIEKEEGDGGFAKEDIKILAETFRRLRDADHKRYKKHLCERYDALMETEEFLNKVIGSRVIDINFSYLDARKLKRLIASITTNDKE